MTIATGTEKQIAFAADVKQNVLDAVAAKFPAGFEALRDEFIKMVEGDERARFWIDSHNFNKSPRAHDMTTACGTVDGLFDRLTKDQEIMGDIQKMRAFYAATK